MSVEETKRLTKAFIEAATALHKKAPTAFPLLLEAETRDGNGKLTIRAKFSRRSQKELDREDALARIEVEQSLFQAGIIEDPDMDGHIWVSWDKGSKE